MRVSCSKNFADGWFYLHQISGKWHAKCIVGNTPINCGEQLSPEQITKIKELGKQYEQANPSDLVDMEDTKDL